MQPQSPGRAHVFDCSGLDGIPDRVCDPVCGHPAAGESSNGLGFDSLTPDWVNAPPSRSIRRITPQPCHDGIQSTFAPAPISRWSESAPSAISTPGSQFRFQRSAASTRQTSGEGFVAAILIPFQRRSAGIVAVFNPGGGAPIQFNKIGSGGGWGELIVSE